LTARRHGYDGSWELVHPKCVRERREDLDEALRMLDAGETEVARDELRWLLDGCGDFLAVHRMLGELALAADDVRLARAHFGHAFELGWSALPPDCQGPVPYRVPANQDFLEAAKGLAWCYRRLGETRLALAVVEVLMKCDPDDFLGVSIWQREWVCPVDTLQSPEDPHA
jgi:hypothetical protein